MWGYKKFYRVLVMRRYLDSVFYPRSIILYSNYFTFMVMTPFLNSRYLSVILLSE